MKMLYSHALFEKVEGEMWPLFRSYFLKVWVVAGPNGVALLQLEVDFHCRTTGVPAPSINYALTPGGQ